jgi:valyl-tRNA synthetase
MALDKRYDPRTIEQNKYRFWLERGYFQTGDTSLPSFSMVIPPPNVTGKLHLGHAWNGTIQDILARYKRLKGFDVLWLAGMDHAGIATQAVVEAKLRGEGKSRFELGREAFLAKVWEWKDVYAKNIRMQWAKMGFSLNYDYERFTLDKGLNEAVNKVFVDLYKKGLIYRGERIINWDPAQQTALSNIEVIHKDVAGSLYYVSYRLVDTLEPLFVATTRPETMFGDVCLVVHPDDERYQSMIGRQVINPANKQQIHIISDAYVDRTFGSGVMKCTPAHDQNDFVIGEKYGLAHPSCMNDDGTMNELAGAYKGLDRFECRQQLVERMRLDGNLLKIETITHAIGYSERSDVPIEPRLSKQWFVKMRPLAEAAIKLQASEKAITFFPERFEKTFLQWMDKVEDWCISRQLWWGHQIPAYYHKYTKEVIVSEKPPLNMQNYEQDQDVLDTWFSSALWPFSTLGWPKDTMAYSRYFPVDVMVTAYDIIFFWVSRMVFQSLEFTSKRPFKDVYIHGLIRDEQGRKMSKSLGNGVDPMDVISQYGADALRYFLATNSTPGQDTRYIEEKVSSAANYLNKIWNAARYILMTIPSSITPKELNANDLGPLDKYIMSRLQQTIDNVATNLDKYELGMASSYLYDFVYDDFCSWYLELSKVTLNSLDTDKIATTHQVLYHCLKAILVMIYPFCPFISEEIYQNMPFHKTSIMEEKYPDSRRDYDDAPSLNDVTLLQSIIKDVRNYKVTHQLPPNHELTLYITAKNEHFIAMYRSYIERFTFSLIALEVDASQLVDNAPFTYPSGELIIIEGINQVDALAKLDEDISKVQYEIARALNLLDNPAFRSKAPHHKIEMEEEKLATHRATLQALLEKRSIIEKMK